MTRQEKNKEITIENNLEVVASIINLVKDIDRHSFEDNSYSDSSYYRMKKMEEQAKELFTKYDSNPSPEIAQSLINHCYLKSALKFSLVKLRKMVYETGELKGQSKIRERLQAQEKILRESEVPVFLMPLRACLPTEIQDYIKTNYSDYENLNDIQASTEKNRHLVNLVCGPTYFPKDIPVKILVKKTLENHFIQEGFTLKMLSCCIEHTKSYLKIFDKKTGRCDKSKINLLI